MYTTVIHHLKSFNLATSCSCPYNYGVICKHTVAALLTLKSFDYENSIPKKEETSTKLIRDYNESVCIKDYKHLTIEKLKEYATANRIRNADSNNDLKIENIVIKKNVITVSIAKNKYYYYNPSKYQIKFKHNKDCIEVTSTDKSKVNKNTLRSTELFCLLKLIKNNPNFFENIFLKQDELKEKHTKKYGLRPSEFHTYFEFVLEGNNLKIKNKPKANGLVPVEDNLSISKDFKQIINKIAAPTQFTIQTKAKKNALTLAFVLSKSSNGGTIYSIIEGKLNKAGTKLISRINEFYGDLDNVNITDSQHKIINLVNEYNSLNDYNEEAFNLSKQIFNKLTKEKFVYFVDDNYYKKKNNLEDIILNQSPVKVNLNVSKTKRFLEAKPQLKIDDKIINLKDINEEYSTIDLIYYKDEYYHFNSFKEILLYVNFKEGFKIKKDQDDLFFNEIIKPLSKDFDFTFNENTYKYKKVTLDYKTEQIYLSEKDNHIIMQPQVVYDNDNSVLLANNGNYLVKDESNDTIIEYERNFDLENDFINQIANLHPNFEEQKVAKYFYLSYEDFTKDFWFYKFFDKLNLLDVEVFGFKNLKNFKYSPYKGNVTTSINSGEDWFDVSIDVSFGNNQVSLKDIKKAIINKQKFIQLKDGSVGILPEVWLHKLEKYFRAGEIKNDKLAISKLKYSIIDELFDEIDETEIIEEIANKRKRLAQFTEIAKTKIPTQIKAELRDYQIEGFNWLNFLHDMKWGGILADDMGLGKTLQILTFIQHVIKKNKTPNLVVVPTSLLFNWKAEVEKFAPKLKIHFHYGSDRAKDTKAFNKKNIIFTTYGTLLRDIEFLTNYQFNYIIIDESQAIKNPTSRRYKAVNLIKAKNRIALTGTPIENSTFDLFAQMNFVNPGFFGSINNFKLNYSNPIDKEGNELIASELQRLINPFILRRTKEKVAKELPPKTENVLYCDMEPEQRKIYDAYLNNYRNKLLKNVEKEGVGKSKMMVLQALTRLRQICDSPSLIDEIDYNNKAIKIQEIVNHITKKTANHKVLVFSQFVGMLSLIKTELDRLSISYEYLDGKSSTKKRELSVNNFQNNNELRVFLISLKAGGTGLNLTAADYVYIVDPWWNPAVENQAIDRCYRIGQDKTVFAYRMICKNTIEEKIVNLQAKKKQLAADIIQTEENIMKNLTVNDIKDLFN